MDWAEMSEQFGLGNPETLRKAGVGVQLVHDAQMISDGCGSALDATEGFRERQKMRDLNRQITAEVRAQSRSELLRETIQEAIKGLPSFRAPFHPVSDEDRNRRLLVGIGDIHFGADIEVRGLMGEMINGYNENVFQNRMWDLLEELTDIADKEDICEMDICFVGDLLDGMLRQSQLMRLQYGVVESTMRFSEFLATWLSELSLAHKINVYGAMGNHSEIRPLNSKKGDFEEENLERIIFWYLKSRLSDNPNVHIEMNIRNVAFFESAGYNVLLIHGDGEQSLDKIAANAITQYGRPIDFVICGHKHREMEFPSGMSPRGDTTIIRVPSVCGVDSYAMRKGYNGQPGATAMVLEAGYGRRCVYPIRL